MKADESTPLVKPSREPADCAGDLTERLGGGKALAYTVLTTLATAPTLVFSSLHMVAFLKVHGLSALQVATAHVCYMVWNTLNDVFAGYFTDAYASHFGSRLSLVASLQTIWVLVVFLPFLSMPDHLTSGTHGVLYYLVCICLFDGCLSFVSVARGSLMKQISGGEPERVHLKRLNCVFGNVEGLVMLMAYYYWQEDDLRPFSIFLAIVIVCALCFNWLSAAWLAPYAPRDGGGGGEVSLPPPRAVLQSLPSNAWVFIGVMAAHELQSVFQGQFAILLIETLLSDWSKESRVGLLAGLGAAAGVGVFLSTWLVDRFSLYSVLLWSFRLKVLALLVLSLAASASGTTEALVVAAMVVNALSVALVAGFYLVVIVGLMDELAACRHRQGSAHPLAAYPATCGPALLMGASAFFVKPFNSLGPILGAWLFAEKDGGSLAAGEGGRELAFALMVAVPLCVGLVQWLLWACYFSPWSPELLENAA